MPQPSQHPRLPMGTLGYYLCYLQLQHQFPSLPHALFVAAQCEKVRAAHLFLSPPVVNAEKKASDGHSIIQYKLCNPFVYLVVQIMCNVREHGLDLIRRNKKKWFSYFPECYYIISVIEFVISCLLELD